MSNYLSKLLLDEDTEVLLKDADGRIMLEVEKQNRELGDTNLSNDIDDLNTSLTNAINSNVSTINNTMNSYFHLLNDKINLETTNRTNADDKIVSDMNAKNYVNVKDYGAKGDGTTDDTNAFINAINATPIHGTLFIPIGNYKITQILNIYRPITLLGDYIGWDIEEASNYVTNFEFRRVLLSFSTNGGIHCHILGCALKNLAISLGGASVSYGIQMDNSSGVVTTFGRFNIIDNVTVVGGSGVGSGILLNSVGLTKISRCLVYGFGVGYWCSNTCTSLMFDTCWSQNSTSEGYHLENCYYCVLSACASDSSNAIGYNLVNCRGVELVGCGAELNQYGFNFNGCRGCKLSGAFVCSALSDRAINITNSNISVIGFSIDETSASGSYVYDMVVNDATSKIFIAATEINKASINGTAKTYTNGDVRGSASYATL